MLDWVVELVPVFDEAVDVICGGEPPKRIDSRFLYSFAGKNLAVSHPESTVKLLIHILKDKTSLEFSDSYVREICESLPESCVKNNYQLKEALLRCGITFFN